MALTRRHPKTSKVCAFCNYWMSDIKLKFINSTVGYEYESYTRGSAQKQTAVHRHIFRVPNMNRA